MTPEERMIDKLTTIISELTEVIVTLSEVAQKALLRAKRAADALQETREEE